MNELNLPENTLRSWRPRRPAARLRRRLFESDDAGAPSAPWLWARLAPTLACVCLTLMVLQHDSSHYGGQRAAILTLACSNQMASVQSPDDALSSQNHVDKATLECTNRSLFRSSMSFAPSNQLSK